MQPLRLLCALWAVAHGYRFAESDARGASVNSTSKLSIRAFTWRGFADYAKFDVKGTGEVAVEKPFLSLPNPTQNNPCKLLVHKDAVHKLIQPSSTVKKHLVAMIKAALVQICKLTFAKPHARIYHSITLKRCAALELGEEAGRMKALSSTVQDEELEKEHHDEVDDADNEEEETLKADGDGDAVGALQDSMSSAVTSYSCLAMEGPELDKGLAVKNTDVSVFRNFRHSFRGMMSSLKGGTMARLAKKLAGYTHGACPPFSDCPQWLKLLRHIAKPEDVEGADACKEHLISKGLMEMKGVKGSRVAAIDLSRLHVKGMEREVLLAEEGSKLSLQIINNLAAHTENVTKVTLKQSKKYAEVSSPWSDLNAIISHRIEECAVEKIGVFNMGLKRRLNSFQISERFPWKTVFFSSIALQIFTENAHGKHYGFDLHGDPEEIERPCKWMQAAMAKGYQPRNWFFFASKIDFENLNFSIPLPKRLYESDNRSLLWVDEQGKFPLPEWVRGMRKMDLDPDKWPAWMFRFNDGRNLDHYIANMQYDVRGLHHAEDSRSVLEALRTLGWHPDPLVRIHPEILEKHHWWESAKEYTEQVESVQISAKLVTAVYPYSKQLAGLQSLPTDILRHGGESKLWSIYDYTEAYVDSCFVFEAMSLPSADDADDGWTDLGGRLSASMTFCTNNHQSPDRAKIPPRSVVDRKDVMEELREYFSQNRPDGVKVAPRSTKSCSSEGDCSGNTCMGPSDCKENEDSPCPVGYGCACDTSKNEMLFTVALGASLLTEVVQNSLILGPGWIAGCTAIAVGSLGALAPLCPVLMPMFFAALAPFGSDVVLAFIFASVVGGLNTCGCVPLKCKSSALLSNSVCALNHPQGEDEEMLNPYHYVPPPKMKCVPGMLGCSLQSCNASDMAVSKVGWHIQQHKHFWHDVGVYNCRPGVFNASNTELVKAFDYKQFADEHKDMEEVQTSLAPQYQAPEKLSLLQQWTVGLPRDLAKCFAPGNSTAGTVAKRVAAPLCSVVSVVKTVFSFILDIVEKLLMFVIDVVMNVLKLVRALVFTIFGTIHKHLLGGRVWRQECEAVGFSAPSPEDVTMALDSLEGHANATSNKSKSTSFLEFESDMFGPDSLCMSGGRLRPCDSLERGDLWETYATSWADVGL